MITRRILALLLALALLFSMTACVQLDENGNPISSSGSDAQSPQTEEAKFDSYLTDIFAEAVGDNLLDSRFLVQNPATFGVNKEEIPKTFGVFDFEEMDKSKETWEKDYAELTDFDRDQLSADQQLIYDMILLEMELQKKTLGMEYYNEINSSLLGYQSNIPSVLAEFRFYTVQDAYDYTEMVMTAPKYFEDMVEYQRRRSEQGLFMSDVRLDETLEACRSFIAQPEDNMLLATFTDRIAKLPDITEAQKAELEQKNKEAIQQGLIPAYQLLIDELEALRGTGKNEGGICNLPNGKSYYESMVWDATGSDRSVQDIAVLLDQMLWNINRDIIKIMIRDETVFDRMQEGVIPDSTPEEMIDYLREATANRFPALEHLEYQIKYVHPSMEENSSPAFFFLPPVDAAGENPIYINPKYADGQNGSLFPTMAHEGYPGHMYQSNYFAQQKPHAIRKLLDYNGYSEGWATYVEYLSYEMADAEDEAVLEMMRLNDLMGLVVGSRIDIGVNYQHWDKEDCVSFVENTGLIPEAADFYYDMALQEPANYLSYCVGAMEFFILRQETEEAMGDSFDEMAYHKAILDIGPAPFSFVRQAVEAYVSSVMGESSASDSQSAAAA